MAQAEYIKQFLSRVKNLHLALMALLTLLLGGAVYLRQSMNTPADATFEYILLGAGFVAAFLVFSVGTNIYRTRLNVLKNAERIEMKLEGFRAAMMFRFSLWEGVAILGLIGYTQTGNLMFMGIAVFFMLLLALMRPTPEKIARELELTEEEKQLLQGL